MPLFRHRLRAGRGVSDTKADGALLHELVTGQL